MLVLAVIIMLFVIGKNEDTVEGVGKILLGIQCICIIVAQFPVEKALKSNFDEYGKRK